MSYWRKCLSTGDYQYIATGEPAPEDIVVQWWEVELARKDKHIAELEAAIDVRDRKLSDISSACESAGCLYDEAMDDFIFKQKQRIAELEAQVASAYNEGCDDGHVNRFVEGDKPYNENNEEEK